MTSISDGKNRSIRDKCRQEEWRHFVFLSTLGVLRIMSCCMCVSLPLVRVSACLLCVCMSLCGLRLYLTTVYVLRGVNNILYVPVPIFCVRSKLLCEPMYTVVSIYCTNLCQFIVFVYQSTMCPVVLCDVNIMHVPLSIYCGCTKLPCMQKYSVVSVYLPLPMYYVWSN